MFHSYPLDGRSVPVLTREVNNFVSPLVKIIRTNNLDGMKHYREPVGESLIRGKIE